MRLAGVHVKAVHDTVTPCVLRQFGGMSVLAPDDDADKFIVGSVHKLAEQVSKESYPVIVVARHVATGGVVLFLKLWSPN